MLLLIIIYKHAILWTRGNIVLGVGTIADRQLAASPSVRRLHIVKKVTFGAIIRRRFSTLTFWPCERFGTILSLCRKCHEIPPMQPATWPVGELSDGELVFCVNDASQPMRDWVRRDRWRCDQLPRGWFCRGRPFAALPPTWCLPTRFCPARDNWRCTDAAAAAVRIHTSSLGGSRPPRPDGQVSGGALLYTDTGGADTLQTGHCASLG